MEKGPLILVATIVIVIAIIVGVRVAAPEAAQNMTVNESIIDELREAANQTPIVTGNPQPILNLTPTQPILPGDLTFSDLDEDLIIVRDGKAARIISERAFGLVLPDTGALRGVSLAVEAAGEGKLYAEDLLVYDGTYDPEARFGDVQVLSRLRSPRDADTLEGWIRENLEEGALVSDPYGVIDWSAFQAPIDYNDSLQTLPVTFKGTHRFLLMAAGDLDLVVEKTDWARIVIVLQDLDGNIVATEEVKERGTINRTYTSLSPQLYRLSLATQDGEYTLGLGTDKVLVVDRIHPTGRAELFFDCPRTCRLTAEADGIEGYQNLLAGRRSVLIDDEDPISFTLNEGSQRLLLPKGALEVSGFGAASLNGDSYFAPFRNKEGDGADVLVMPLAPTIPLAGEAPYTIDMRREGDDLEIYSVIATPIE